jgi:hypothetical protein
MIDSSSRTCFALWTVVITIAGGSYDCVGAREYPLVSGLRGGGRTQTAAGPESLGT